MEAPVQWLIPTMPKSGSGDEGDDKFLLFSWL